MVGLKMSASFSSIIFPSHLMFYFIVNKLLNPWSQMHCNVYILIGIWTLLPKIGFEYIYVLGLNFLHGFFPSLKSVKLLFKSKWKDTFSCSSERTVFHFIFLVANSVKCSSHCGTRIIVSGAILVCIHLSVFCKRALKYTGQGSFA